MSLLTVWELSCGYEDTKLFSDVSFELNAGEALSITGANGTGKTTLCYCLCGIIPHIRRAELMGQVLLNGTAIKDLPLNKIALTLGWCGQDPEQQLHAETVEQELAFGPENLCKPSGEIDEIISGVLYELGISHLRHVHCASLSGGQKQLVVLAAILALAPRVIILDEALSMVDSEGKRMALEVLSRRKAEGCALVMVAHEPQLLALCDKTLCL